MHYVTHYVMRDLPYYDNLGNVFGSVLPAEAVDQAKGFLESVDKSSLDDFEELQKRA
eukprot:CAMPEP_0170116856 /NCGR_PEP_ID=MMETSP0020_2-20130122/12575_1 /TAXON_ID=98059 /ORGANISM="Dinobryon sp., Strain UTEXLB2267" /LENGTH=56 /DNA_ID=CAMNT_0010345167 /DNA_START=30 /DNA_END=196 /DNA_ORIENTATION=+